MIEIYENVKHKVKTMRKKLNRSTHTHTHTKIRSRGGRKYEVLEIKQYNQLY